MRRVFTTAEATAEGLTKRQLEYGVERGVHVRITRGVYADGSDALDAFTEALGRMRADPGYAWGEVAGVLHDFDSVEVTHRRPKRRRVRCEVTTVQGYACTTALETIVDLAETMDDITWEQALESGLRKKLFTVQDIAQAPSERIKRVLALRPESAPPTESLLETLMVQLARELGLPDPVRQFVVYDKHGEFVARVDLAWPDIGLFLELDSRDHDKQLDYDTTRETRVVAATGWLCGRFRWRQVRHLPKSTGRRLVELYEQAAARPLATV
ncbi:MAG: hypothetical protein Q8K63_06020 [Acidimicrobiales bacterium]|nr:hypothetical protein [Acidimicrobiales bacterium]